MEVLLSSLLFLCVLPGFSPAAAATAAALPVCIMVGQPTTASSSRDRQTDRPLVKMACAVSPSQTGCSRFPPARFSFVTPQGLGLPPGLLGYLRTRPRPRLHHRFIYRSFRIFHMLSPPAQWQMRLRASMPIPVLPRDRSADNDFIFLLHWELRSDPGRVRTALSHPRPNMLHPSPTIAEPLRGLVLP